MATPIDLNTVWVGMISDTRWDTSGAEMARRWVAQKGKREDIEATDYASLY